MAHKGIREFQSEELSAIALGQNGFKIITNATVICGGDFLLSGETATSGYEDINYFIALKVIDDDAEVEARSVTLGDDLTLGSGGTADFTSPATLVNGDIIYGAFDKIEVANVNYIVSYIGKNK